jgi:hypothetical protein
LRYNIGEVGEMHHNPAKNVLFVDLPLAAIAARLKLSVERVRELLDSAKKKMYAARLQRPTPYVDKTVYVSWNSLCISAYLEAARVLGMDEARRFALRSLDRILSEGWKPDTGLLHVISYSDPNVGRREVRGMLDDYAYTVCSCLDAYEATADLSYFHFARAIGDAMVAKFFDSVSGGFSDREVEAGENQPGVLGTRRKPFQDSPTPAGNPMAAIALSRLFGYTNETSYRDRAEETLEVFAGMATQYGIFGATYGIAAAHFSEPHTQVVVVGSGRNATEMEAEAVRPFRFGKSVVRLEAGEAVAGKLPPALAATVPNIPGIANHQATAIVCSNFTCRPPLYDVSQLREVLAHKHSLKRSG